MPATTRWREFQGSDHFITKLRQTQNDGIKDRRREKGDHHFRLLADGGVRTRTVSSGPFLGMAAVGRDLPQAFEGDWLEFVRAYRAGFLFWLRTEAGRSDRDSAERFALLLKTLVQAEDPEAQAAAWEAVMGMPLSTPDLEEPSLARGFDCSTSNSARPHDHRAVGAASRGVRPRRPTSRREAAAASAWTISTARRLVTVSQNAATRELEGQSRAPTAMSRTACPQLLVVEPADEPAAASRPHKPPPCWRTSSFRLRRQRG